MIDNKIKSILEERATIHSEDYINIEKCCKKEIEVLVADMNSTIDFILNRCTGEEFVWLSEVFDDVVEQSQSCEFIATLYETVKKFPEESKTYNLMEFIDSAKEFLI